MTSIYIADETGDKYIYCEIDLPKKLSAVPKRYWWFWLAIEDSFDFATINILE